MSELLSMWLLGGEKIQGGMGWYRTGQVGGKGQKSEEDGRGWNGNAVMCSCVGGDPLCPCTQKIIKEGPQ